MDPPQPQVIEGPEAWHGREMASDPRWQFQLSSEDIAELEAALEDVLGQEVEVSQDAEEEMDMGADDEMDLGADAELDLGADAGEEEEEEELEEVNDDVIEEVFARVIQRLTKETKSNKK